MMTKRPHRRHQHLCEDAGYTGAAALKIIESHGYIPHVKGRWQEARELRRDPKKKLGTGGEVAHSWFNQLPQAGGSIRNA